MKNTARNFSVINSVIKENAGNYSRNFIALLPQLTSSVVSKKNWRRRQSP